MFGTLKQAIETCSGHAGITRNVLAALPESAYATRPHEKSRTGGELAWHLATASHWFVSEALKLKVRPKPDARPETSAALVEAYDKMTRDCLAALKKKNDAWMRKKTDFFGTPTTNGAILGVMLIHDVHHRGQLGLYVRMAGGKVPAICGPSADDPGPAHPKKKAKSGK